MLFVMLQGVRTMLNFAIVHYNTPELTTCLCGSIYKLHPGSHITVFDNSDKRPLDTYKILRVSYIDNTHGQIINFDQELKKYPLRQIKEQTEIGCNFGTAKHSMSVDWLCKHLVDNFILLDSDVLVKRPVDFIDDNFICCSDTTQIHEDIYRILPMISYINVKKMREHNISFFDGSRMHGLVDVSSRYNWYDTGASFYEDIVKLNLFHRIDCNDYIVHYGSGSWRQPNKRPIFDGNRTDVYTTEPFMNWLDKYNNLWDIK